MRRNSEELAINSKARLSIVHFFHVDFRRCKIMDKHLTTLAERYPDTVFLRIDVANAPFLVNKLQVKVLPCVFCFIDGANKDQIVGFEGLANKETDDFSTAELELRLKQSGVISAIKQATVHSILGLDKTRSDDLDLD
ncbi:uncharacterized protein L969DRAFT_84414 [Mixia osmundae IAM 14324]|uniref:uncharacterized protein n=1 Tax=Mixia osmundae (strain CBS 9802 / IAM 14324 / JCM 22182 / KY 12970) TaxID=764103 RepID=UPI0004A548FB|nr:uncharacterized protein L969DRAFT_84414 [Mixia osmundae IAM 14324]KEI42550.1 hypothetical protein L969DRAFT_84414 [Mixia osmundae IAM 14324]